MYQIKRAKTAFDPERGEATTTTHFAKKVQPDGKVSEWSADEADAQIIDKPLVLKVEAEYKDRRKAGEVTVYAVGDKHEKLVVTPPAASATPPPPPPAAAAPAAPAAAADQKPAAQGQGKGK